MPGCRVEVLIPDFEGNWDALRAVVEADPVVLNHNTETVPRLYPRVRPKARYERSLELLRRVKEIDPGMTTKSGVMVGLGETIDEIAETMRDLRDHGCDLLTVGQYLRPDDKHLEVARYWRPEEFEDVKRIGIELGFQHVEAGPFVRSSYHAGEQAAAAARPRDLQDRESRGYGPREHVLALLAGIRARIDVTTLILPFWADQPMADSREATNADFDILIAPLAAVTCKIPRAVT
jgi:hypothetical protein